MATALVYLVVLLVVAALFFVIASVVFGRGEELAPIPPGSSPTWLPDGEVSAGDVRALRFQQAVRGYRMAEVDWVLDRLAGQLEQVIADRDDLRRRLADLDGASGGHTANPPEPTTPQLTTPGPTTPGPTTPGPTTPGPTTPEPTTPEPTTPEPTEEPNRA